MPFEGPVIPPALPPFDPVSFVLDLVGFFLKLLGVGAPDLSLLSRAINNSWANLVVGIGFVYNAIRAVIEFLKSLIVLIFRGLQHIISDILHGHLLDALHDIQKLFHALHDLFAPILNFIQKLRGWFYKYVYPWIKLVQNILSTVRVILAAFRILGAKWAAKLDADIARIQSYLTTALQDIVGTLNQASTWLNFALDPMGIFRKGIFSNTLFNSLPVLSRAVNFGKDRYLTASEAQNTQGDRALISGGAAVATRNPDGSVTYSDAMVRINKHLDDAMKKYAPAGVIH